MKLIVLRDHGQSLIEIVVAVGIIAMVLVGVSDLITRSLSLSNFQKNKNVAINIAQNQINYYRQQRDLAPTLFFTDPNPQSSFHDCVENPDPVKYECVITYDNTGLSNGTKMTVAIKWNYGGKAVTTQLSEVLAKPSK